MDGARTGSGDGHGHGLRRGIAAWRGRVDLGRFEGVRLVVEGGWLRPCPRALAAVGELPRRAPGVMDAAASAILDRIRPWTLDGAPLPPLPDGPEGMWDILEPVHVAIRHRGGATHAELGLRVAWDEEHVWGARFADWSLLGLSESVAGR